MLSLISAGGSRLHAVGELGGVQPTFLADTEVAERQQRDFLWHKGRFDAPMPLSK